jgi:uncharacterized membrane protein
LLFLSLTDSVIIDTYRIQRVSLHTYLEYTSDEISLAKWVTQSTDIHSIWLTGYVHNHWLFNLTGRQSVMTFPGWLWTQGYHYLPVQTDVDTIYLGGAEAKRLLAKYQVNYVVIGDLEKGKISIDQDFFDENYPIAFQLGATKIYRVQ